MSGSTPDSEAQRALYAALADAIKETDGVAKKGRNDQGRGYMYAKAEDVIREAERVLSMNNITVAPGLSSIQEFSPAEKKGAGERPIFVLKQEFICTHPGGGVLRGEVCVGVGTNLAAGPAQAISSALTGAERDYYRCLLRMPRCDADDPDHPDNTRRAEPDREEQRGETKSAIEPPKTRKVVGVLAAIRAVTDPDRWQGLAERWDAAISGRGTPELGDCGYSDDDVVSVTNALKSARERCGLR